MDPFDGSIYTIGFVVMLLFVIVLIAIALFFPIRYFYQSKMKERPSYPIYEEYINQLDIIKSDPIISKEYEGFGATKKIEDHPTLTNIYDKLHESFLCEIYNKKWYEFWIDNYNSIFAPVKVKRYYTGINKDVYNDFSKCETENEKKALLDKQRDERSSSVW